MPGRSTKARAEPWTTLTSITRITGGRRLASYVALTRQRDGAQVFVARETARDAGQLAWQKARGEVKAASLAWATREEVARLQTAHEQASAPSHATRRAQQWDQAEAHWRGRSEPSRAVPDDRLKAKVRDALARRERQAAPDAAAPAQPGERPQEGLRRELQALDRDGLWAVARADIVGPGFMQRPMTAQDVARRLDPAYAAAADRAEQLRKETAAIAKSIAHYEGVRQANQAAGDRRWQEMGFLRQVAHKTGARRDHWLSLNEDHGQWALEQLAKLDPRSAELSQQLPAAEKTEATAFARIEPAAAAELAQRQARGAAAREILQERWEQEREERAREQQQERLSRGRDRGFGLER
jgi:hypothetical protein